MRLPRLRRIALVSLLLLAAGATAGVLDPHRMTDDGATHRVAPSVSPDYLWRHAKANTMGTSHTWTERFRSGPDDRDPHHVMVGRYDPDARRFHGILYMRGADGGDWEVSEVFYGDAVAATRSGTGPAPDPSRPIQVEESDARTDRGLFDDARRSQFAPLRADEFRELNVTDDAIVIGVTDAGDYADLHRMDESEVLPGSHYRVRIDRETGRITRIVDRKRLNRSDGVTEVYSVRTFDAYGRTTVDRPTWAKWRPMELLYDAVSF